MHLCPTREVAINFRYVFAYEFDGFYLRCASTNCDLSCEAIFLAHALADAIDFGLS